ncbi:1-deoxy-D-xylulose-5-phosphate synthase [Dasania sp. GY-MA-18]|uniref:1-deoxy-D-xylulose-5-phosphate synthase n=1 Tax=Dasania phycosphaerae TaxID=2950436 RepID=A0A9J6RI52_9GAMM|nr:MULTISPECIES: 1-deoxy-D-xylulose-5-phosphate synthase [Dasania]MCR8921516.1 1-deoxy-D-xylulose-5-phosphate synthase [Dasania sp. GY-MA-18]MCZ0863944.1 1-deoxy-D-xylulose-5-phosphate synthase [Dasania phycosphaerae]MCZ0867672.1 1-deoxy-D-xylulose-5-phosphate synthase [Dasania phycosphaerae]
MFNEIPQTRPATPLLDGINETAQLRALPEEQLPQLVEELRAYLLYTVGQTGGHFGAGLGVVELTVALHYLYNTPEDRIVWDVGHQTYPHKILTGRREQMHSMRQQHGLAGFPKRAESEYDTFGVGHSSTSISAALGMAIAARDQGIDRKAVAVIGDGAMTAGMAFEALAHAAHVDTDMLVVLNDNQMSISHNTGGLNTYFSKIWASKTYTGLREGSKKVLSRLPPAWDLAKRVEEHMKGMVAPGTLFEELGFNYIGPIDGHDLPNLISTIGNMRELKGPQLLHIITQKGKGFGPAEKDPVGYHAINKIEAKAASSNSVKKPKYQDVFGQWLCDMAASDDKLIGITPAMCDGSGMTAFAKQYPQRFHDVAIAEQHAVTLAAGMACDGLKPVVAIYSTFLQRAYDQLIHDVALQELDVTFAIDRAGLVGEDGPTHAGSFDISFLRCIPHMLVMTPSDEDETRQLLYTGYQHKGPAAIRYPRGTGPGAHIEPRMTALPIGKAVQRRAGKQVAILNFGTLLPAALAAAENLNATVIDMRFAKPLDQNMISAMASKHELLVTLEENSIAGGAGAGVSEYLNQEGITQPLLHLGLPDEFIDHGKHADLLASCGLDSVGIEQAIRQRLLQLASAKKAKAS